MLRTSHRTVLAGEPDGCKLSDLSEWPILMMTNELKDNCWKILEAWVLLLKCSIKLKKINLHGSSADLVRGNLDHQICCTFYIAFNLACESYCKKRKYWVVGKWLPVSLDKYLLNTLIQWSNELFKKRASRVWRSHVDHFWDPVFSDLTQNPISWIRPV